MGTSWARVEKKRFGKSGSGAKERQAMGCGRASGQELGRRKVANSGRRRRDGERKGWDGGGRVPMGLLLMCGLARSTPSLFNFVFASFRNEKMKILH